MLLAPRVMVALDEQRRQDDDVTLLERGTHAPLLRFVIVRDNLLRFASIYSRPLGASV